MLQSPAKRNAAIQRIRHQSTQNRPARKHKKRKHKQKSNAQKEATQRHGQRVVHRNARQTCTSCDQRLRNKL